MARVSAIEADTAFWLALNINSIHLTDGQLYQLCDDNPELRFEVSADGELIVMSPTSMATERKNAKIIQRLANWTEKDGTGECFGSSGMFTLPNGAKRSPDAAWISKSRWNRLTDEEKNSFAGICPEFVIELRSASDRLPKLQEKMEEYMANGARLGWLLDPLSNRAFVYSPDVAPERLDRPTVISAEPILPGFDFNFREILS